MTRTKNKLSLSGKTICRKSNNHDNCSELKPPRKRRRSNAALREIKFFQKTTHLLIPMLPFARLVKQIVEEQRPGVGYRWQATALQALQEMAENYIVELMEDTNLACIHAKRKTIQIKDLFHVRRIRGRK